MAYLTIENFNKSFGNTDVLKGIDLSIEKGEVVNHSLGAKPKAKILEML